MKLDFIIDVVCPWCFVGKRQLDLALGAMTGPQPDVAYRPYQLSPDTPKGGVDRTDYYQRKFGDSPQLRMMRDHLSEMGTRLGIQFDFDSACRIANSLDAHRLIRWAKTPGLQADVADAVMSRYFERCDFIGDHGLLVEVAEEAGMDGALVRELLAGDQDKDLIRGEAENARTMGVQGVPFYLFDQKSGVGGAQEAPVLAAAMDRFQTQEA